MRSRGAAIIVVLLATALAASVAFALVALSSNNLMHAFAETESMTALYAAEAGAWLKVAQIKAGDETDLAAPQEMPGVAATYTVRVFRGGDLVPAAEFLARSTDFTVPGAETYYVLSTGKTENERRRQVAILFGRSSSLYDYAIFARERILLEGASGGHAFTDTYDSATGLPDDHTRARIGVNSTLAGAIEFKENAAFKARVGWPGSGAGTADVVGGPGAPSGIVLGGAAGTQFASFQTLAQERTFDPVTLPFGVGTTDHTIESGTVTLAPGGYKDVVVKGSGKLILDTSAADPSIFVFDKLEMLGNPPLDIPVIEIDDAGTGNGAQIYVVNDFKVEKGALINPLAQPSKMEFKSTGKDIILEGANAAFGVAAYYVAYAPDSQIKVKGGEIYGAVVGNRVEIIAQSGADAVVHFDKQLLNTTSGTTNFEILSVQKL